MTDMPDRDDLVSGATTEAAFQEALGDFYDVVNQLGLLGPAESNALDSSGNITPTKCNITMDTESDAPTDTLNLIVPTNVGEKMIFIRSESDARLITVKHMASGTGKISLNTGADVVLKKPTYVIALLWDATAGVWQEMWRNFGVVIPSGDEADARTSLGLGTAATRNTGTSTGQIPLKENFGTAAFANTGTGGSNVPLNSSLGALAFLSQVTSSQMNASGVVPGTYGQVTVDAQGRVTGGAPFGLVIRHVVLSVNGTYTPHANMIACTVECLGGGGGSYNSHLGSPYGSSGGGGGGGYSKKYYARAAVVPSVAYTIGAAGAANGGAGGQTTFLGQVAYGGNPGNTPTTLVSCGGPGGGASGGDINMQGQCGLPGFGNTSFSAHGTSGAGGSSFYAAGGPARDTGGNGWDGGFGGGGGGGASCIGSGTQLGAPGGQGCIYITEYCSA